MPGRGARKIFALWVTALVLLALFTLYSFITLQICQGIVLIFVIALTAVLPVTFLIGSRI